MKRHGNLAKEGKFFEISPLFVRRLKACYRIPLQESPPSVPVDAKTLLFVLEEYHDAIEEANAAYRYWDKVKYTSPSGLDPRIFWQALEFSRRGESLSFGAYRFRLHLTGHMYETLHLPDRHAIPDFAKGREGVVLGNGAQMEESIASSRMEGANTTREAAKELLSRGQKPKNLGERMIVNNYRTIRFLAAHTKETLTPHLLLDIHGMMVKGTLDEQYASRELAGSFAVSVKIIRSDLEDLVRKGFLVRHPRNKRLVAYGRSSAFSSLPKGLLLPKA